MEKYLAIQVDSGAAGSPFPFEGPGILPNVIGALEQTVASGFESITESILPPGFTWVPLSFIGAEEMANPPSDDDYRKVSKAEMQRGQEAGREYEHGAKRVDEAFFCDEPITLDRKLNSVEYGITSGRHRIEVARARLASHPRQTDLRNLYE